MQNMGTSYDSDVSGVVPVPTWEPGEGVLENLPVQKPKSPNQGESGRIPWNAREKKAWINFDLVQSGDLRLYLLLYTVSFTDDLDILGR